MYLRESSTPPSTYYLYAAPFVTVILHGSNGELGMEALGKQGKNMQKNSTTHTIGQCDQGRYSKGFLENASFEKGLGEQRIPEMQLHKYEEVEVSLCT